MFNFGVKMKAELLWLCKWWLSYYDLSKRALNPCILWHYCVFTMCSYLFNYWEMTNKKLRQVWRCVTVLAKRRSNSSKKSNFHRNIPLPFRPYLFLDTTRSNNKWNPDLKIVDSILTNKIQHNYRVHTAPFLYRRSRQQSASLDASLLYAHK